MPQICTRLTENEKQEIEEYAEKVGMSVASLLRSGAVFYAKWILKQQENFTK